MATIRELRASFTAQANGMKSVIRSVKSEINTLAKEANKSTGSMSKFFQRGTLDISKSFRDMSVSVSKEFNDIGKTIQSAGSRLDSWGKDIKSFGTSTTKALSPLTAFYATAAVGGGKRMIANEQLDILMKNVFRTEESYGKAWDSIKGLTKGTAFMNSDTGQWLSQLVQSNVELDKSEDIMKSIYDFSVGSGQLGIEGDIHNIIMSAVRAEGWDQMTLDMMAQRGLNLAGHVANVLGVSTKEAQEMLKSGEISMEESLDYFVDAVQVGSEGAGGYFAKMADSAQKGGETMTGAWTNTTAAISQLGQDMWESGAWDVLKEALNSITDFLYKLSPALEPIAKTIASILATMVEWIQKLMTAFINLRPKTQALIASLSVIGAVLGPAIFMFGTFVGAVGLALKPLGALFLGLSKIFGVIGKKGLAGAFKSLTGRFSFLTKAFKAFTGPVGIVITLFTLLYTTSQTFRKEFHRVIKSIVDFGKTVYDLLRPMIDTVVDSFKSMIDSFKGTSGGLDSLGAAFAPLLKIIEVLAKVVVGVLGVALGLLIPLINGVVRAVGPLVKAVSSLISVIVNVGMAMISFILGDFRKALEYWNKATQSSVDFFINLWQVVANLFGGIIDALIAEFSLLSGSWEKFGAIAKNVWDGVISLFGKVKDAFMELLGSLSLDPIKGFFSSIATWIADGFASISGSIKSVGEKISQTLIEGITEGLAGVSSKVSNVGNSISDAINSSIDKTIQAFESVGERISDSIAGGLIGKAKDMVKNYFESLVESFQSFSGVATLFAPTLIGMGARALGVAGPVGLIISSIMTLINILMELYQTNDKFRKFVDGAWGAIQSVISGVLKVLQPIFDEFSKAFSEIAEELGPEFAKTKEVIVDSINELKPTFEELGKSFSEIGKVFSDLFKGIIQTARDLVQEFVPIWIELQLTIFETVGDLVTKILPALMKIFKIVFSNVLNTVQAVIPIVVDVVTSLINVVLLLVKSVVPLILTVIKAVLPVVLNIVKAVIPMVASIITLLIDVIMELVKMVVPMILAVIKAVLPVVLKIVKAVIPAVVAIITLLIDVVMELVKSVVPLILTVVKTVFTMVLKIISTVLPIVVKLIMTVIGVVMELVKIVLPQILKIVKAVFPVIQKIIEIAIKIIVKALNLVVAVIQNVVIPAIEFILKVVQIVFPVITKVIEGALNIIIGILDFFAALFTRNWSGMWDAIKKILNGATKIVWSIVKGVFDLIALFIKTVFNGISKFFSMIWSTITKIFQTVITSIYNFVLDKFTAIKDTTTRIFTAIWNFLKSIWNTVLKFIIDIITTLFNRFVTGWKRIYNNTKSVFTSIWNFLKDIWNRVKKFISDSVSNIFKRVTDTWGNLKERTTKIFTDIYNAVKGKFDDIVEAAKKLPSRIGDGIKSMASKVKSGVKAVVDTMAKVLEGGLNGVIGGINWVLGKIGVDESKHIKKMKVTIPEFAKGGTHKGGPMIVGDGGKQELIQTPDGNMMLSPDTDTLMTAPKGTKILSGEKTEELLSNIPAYKKGNSSIADITKAAFKATKHGTNVAKRATGRAVAKGAKKVNEWTGNVWDYVENPSKLLNIALGQLGVSTPKGGSLAGNIAKGGFGKVKTNAVDYIKKKMDEFFTFEGGKGGKGGNLGDSGGSKSVSNNWGIHDYLFNIARTIMSSPLGRGLIITSGYRSTSNTDHGKRNAVDLAGFGRNGGYKRVAQWASRLPRVSYTIGDNTVYGRKHGDGSRPGWAKGHMNHLHVSGYEDGGIINAKQLAWIAEGGWAESIISHDPSKKVRQRAIWKETGDRLGFTDDKSNKEVLEKLERIAKAVEEGHGHDIIMNDRVVGEMVEETVTEKQNRRKSPRRKRRSLN